MTEVIAENVETNNINTTYSKSEIALWNAKSTNLLIVSRLTKKDLFSNKSSVNTGWQSVLNDMKDGGFERLTLAQIKKKWFNIYAKYKNITENKKNESTVWPHYTTIDKYLNSKNENVCETEVNTVVLNTSETSEIRYTNCRLCQEVEGTHSLKTDSNLCQQIVECTSLNICEDLNNLPCSICDDCKTLINTFHKFLLRCRNIDKKLREISKLDILVKSESSTFNCKECPMTLATDELLQEHMRSHKKNKRFICGICYKSFSRITTLRVHQKKHDEDMKNDEIMNVEENIVTDDNVDLNDDNFDDDNDNDDFSIDNIEDNDITIIKEEEEQSSKNDEPKQKIKEKYSCELCVKQFDRRSVLKSHLERIHNNVKYMCPRQDCNKTYTTVKALRNHEKKHLGLNRFLCVSCGKGFVDKSGLVSHEKIHQEIKEYVCNVCSRGFSTMGNLTTHRKKHHQGHRFYCSQCPKAFLAKCSLQRHELVHTGIKEFICDLCDGAFYTNKELIKHKRYHQGVRPYHCNLCFKTFYEKHHLTIHMRSHTGERPYPCKFPGCGKSFTDSNKVSRHMKRTH